MRTVLIIALCLVMLGIGFVGGFATGVATSGVLSGMGAVEGVTFDVQVPAKVKVGEEFDLVLTLTDELGKARKIGDIDFDEQFVAGSVSVGAVTPRAQTESTGFGYKTYTMGQTIPASGRTSITFKAKALAPGEHRTAIDVYVDSLLNFATIDVVVIAE
jgi:hypothetical protein